MCIIAVYHGGKKPPKAEIERMMRKNPDGAGLGWTDGRAVYYEKGYKTADAVMARLEKITNAREIVFHARIATAGGISAAKCHPFPLTSNAARLDSISGTAGAVVFHNGCLPCWDRGLSDTQVFVRDVLAPLYKYRRKKAIKNAIEMAINGSRVAILTAGGVELWGEDWIHDSGNDYSNYGYREILGGAWWKDWRGKAWDDYWDEYEERLDDYEKKRGLLWKE